MENTETANLAGGEDTSVQDTQAAEAGAETEAKEFEPQLDEFGNPIEEEPEEPEEQFEEVERDGKKAKIPAWLKPELMMQADYTRKTQELAEARKSFETEREAAQQADASELQARGHLSAINQQLAQYAQTNWNAEYQRAREIDRQNFDTEQEAKVNDHYRQFQLLRDAQSATLAYLKSRDDERQSKQQHAASALKATIAKFEDEGTAELKKEIPDWGRDKAAKLRDTMKSAYGFTDDDLSDIVDPKLYLVMRDAAVGREQRIKQQKAKTLEQQQQAQPAAKVTRSSAPPQGLDDRLSAEEWTRRRNDQLRKRAR